MNKTALKKFATEARRELLEKVELQARKIGITAESIQKANVESSDAVFIDGKQLSDTQRRQRNNLIARINEIDFIRVMEETAYTWFNRFIALRYMEVNDYLPTKVRVLSSNSGSAEPDMMKEALSLNLELDKEYVYELKMSNKTDELFKYLIKIHCNNLNSYMPFMFESIEDYTEILFPEGLLGTDSFISEMTNVEAIPEENWKKIEVIGWLYQYYIADEKDRLFKAKTKYKSEEIPVATQLFTPDWIVKYMVQNSLGRYWTEAHPEHRDLLDGWEFFLENQQEDFQVKIAPFVRKELNVEDITCFDPAMGSGHILVYMFDVLYEIYSKCGYLEREIPRLIIENNLYGLDIDDRAYQLASFSIVMKALQYNRRFLRTIEKDGLSLNLASVQETNGWTDDDSEYVAGEYIGEKFELTKAFFKQFANAKTFGSLIKVTEIDIAFLEDRLQEIKLTPVEDIFLTEKRERTLVLLPQLIKQWGIMSRQYDIVIMNPPYMSSGSMNKELSNFLRKNYPDSKSDLFASFMEVDHYLKQNAFYSAINQHSWMFLSSFEKLRESVIRKKFIDTMLHLGTRAFEEIGGEVVQSTAFVMRNIRVPEGKGTYLRLVDVKVPNEKREKIIEAVKNPLVSYRYAFKQENVMSISGCLIAYWVSDSVMDTFTKFKTVDDIANAKSGLSTADDNKYLRLWHEVSIKKISNENNGKKWVPYTKGGGFRKWYGNNDYVVNWLNNGEELKSFKRAVIRNPSYYFKEAITWGTVSTSNFSFRYTPEGFIYGNKGNGLFSKTDFNKWVLLGVVNSKVVKELLKIIAPTMSVEAGYVSRIPVCDVGEKERDIEIISKQNVEYSKRDWDSFENSWDFLKSPLLKYSSSTVELAFMQWERFTENQFNQLKSNEEELNRIIIDKYGLQDELSPEVDDKEVTIRKADVGREIRNYISYAIGCTFGRYSLDEEGIICASERFDSSLYHTFPTDVDNIIPIMSGSYFEDDIITKLVEFVKVTFGENTLEENLDFMAGVIGEKKNETSREVLRRYFMTDFYKDHVQVYKKRPIYWLFTSGKEKAFNCIIYMHRYDKTTLSRIRTDYLHEAQIRLDAEKGDLHTIIEGNSTAKEISIAKKELKSLDKKIDELKAYDELLHHKADMQIEIDLDDGVQVNYEKFKGLVAKI